MANFNQHNYIQSANRYMQASLALEQYIDEHRFIDEENDPEYRRLKKDQVRTHIILMNLYSHIPNGEIKQTLKRTLARVFRVEPQRFNFRFNELGTKSQVWKGLAKKTRNGLTKKDLTINEKGNAVIRR